MNRNRKTTRHGFSLLELMIATAILATITSSSMVILRTSYTAWNRHEDDLALRSTSLSVLKHIARQVRQAKAVMAISSPLDLSGSLSLIDHNGNILVWEHDASTNEIHYGITTASNLLATNIAELNFVGLKLDGTSPTTDVGLIHSLQCTTKINITRPSGTEAIKTSNQAWLRAW